MLAGKSLRLEDRRVKLMVADLTLDKAILREIASDAPID
jgi:hypothetical protein